MLPNKARGVVRRVDDRRVVNSMGHSNPADRAMVRRIAAPGRCYNRFVQWRRAGVWGRIMDALAAAHDAAVQMIDTSIRARASARRLHC